MLRILPDRLREEINQISDLLAAIKERTDTGIPGEDMPAADIHEEIFQVQLRAELMLASQRLLALAEVLE